MFFMPIMKNFFDLTVNIFKLKNYSIMPNIWFVKVEIRLKNKNRKVFNKIVEKN